MEKNLKECTMSKSILNVFVPIASKIVKLKTSHGVMCDAQTVVVLLKQCNVLKNACIQLCSSVLHQAKLYADSVLLLEIKEYRQLIDKIMDSLITSTKDLHRIDVGLRDNDVVWDELIALAEHFLSVLIKVLLAWDRSQIRTIESSVNEVKVCLNASLNARSIEALPHCFEKLVTELCEFFCLVEKRCDDLCRRAQRETLCLLCLQLHHSVPLLGIVATASTRHPLSKEYKISKNLVVNRIEFLTKEILLEIGLGSDSYNLPDAGTFVNAVDQVLEFLESYDGVHLPINKVKEPLEEVLRHGIAVAQCNAAVQDKASIMNTCHKILVQMKSFSNLQHSQNPEKVDLIVNCEILVDLMHRLEHKVNTTLIRLIVTTLAQPTRPLQRLLDTFSVSNNSNKNPTDLESLIVAFDFYVDQMFELAGFTIACSIDAASARSIQDSLWTLDWLESCLVPSVINAAGGNASNDGADINTANEKISCDIADTASKANTQSYIANTQTTKFCNIRKHAQTTAYMLANVWKDAITQITQTVDKLMDAAAFAMATKQELHKAWAEMRDHHANREYKSICDLCEYVHALCIRTITVNSVTTFLTEEQLSQVKIGCERLQHHQSSFMDFNDKQNDNCKSIIKTVQFLLTLFSKVSSLLNEDNLSYDDEEIMYSMVHTSLRPNCMQKCAPVVSAEDKSENEALLVISKLPDIPLNTENHPSAIIPCQSYSIGNHSFKIGSVRHNKTASRRASKTTIVCPPQPSNSSTEITKVLSLTNCMNSLRNSKRNFSLKVKEIKVDLNGIITNDSNKEKEEQLWDEKKIGDLNSEMQEKSCVTECSAQTPSIPHQQPEYQKNRNALKQLNGVFESLTYFTCQLTPKSKKHQMNPFKASHLVVTNVRDAEQKDELDTLRNSMMVNIIKSMESFGDVGAMEDESRGNEKNTTKIRDNEDNCEDYKKLFTSESLKSDGSILNTQNSALNPSMSSESDDIVITKDIVKSFEKSEDPKSFVNTTKNSNTVTPSNATTTVETIIDSPERLYDLLYVHRRLAVLRAMQD